MKKKASFQGGVSILLVLLMLTLTAFGLLTLVSAHSDYKMSEKNKESVDRYYALDTVGQKALRDLERLLAREADKTRALGAAGWTVAGHSPLSAKRAWTQAGVTLTACIVFDGQGAFAVAEWKLSHTDFAYDQGLDVWEGE